MKYMVVASVRLLIKSNILRIGVMVMLEAWQYLFGWRVNLKHCLKMRQSMTTPFIMLAKLILEYYAID